MPHRPFLSLMLAAVLYWLGAAGSANASEGLRAELAAPYAYQASEQTILDVLHRFAADHSLQLRVAPQASRRWQTAKVDGWIRASTGHAFLEQLAHAHHFSWFVADHTLYAGAATDSAIERIPLGDTRADAARAALEAVGIYDPRFGWGELTGQGAVLVSGPRAYRALVRRFLASHPEAADPRNDPEPLVVTLRYARAGDAAPRGGTSPTQPGVASLLRQLLTREAAGTQPVFTIPVQSDFPPPLPGTTTPLAQWIGHATPPLAPIPTASRPSVAETLPASIGIVADDRTNSVIVWAPPAWRAHIQRLVDTLDRPAPLVSINVLVIESDTGTVAALNAAHDTESDTRAGQPSFDEQIAQALSEHRIQLLNRQTLVGRMNAHTTLAIGAEASHAGAAPDKAADEPANGRSGNRGDRLDLAARIVPSAKPGTTAIAVDIDLLMAQPTGMPGQTWSNTSSVKLDTAVTLESGAAPRLIASYPVATARAQQRAIFVSAKAL